VQSPETESQLLKTVVRAETALSVAGLAILVVVPLAHSTSTYEWAYPKTFLFQTAGVVLFLALLSAIARRRVYGRRPFRGATDLTAALVAWLAWHLASCLWAQQPSLALERSAEVALMVFLAIGTGYALRSPKGRQLWLIGWAATLIPASLYAIWVYAQPYEQRFVHLFSNRDLAGPFLYLPAAIAISASVSSWQGRLARWQRLLLAALAVLFVLAILSTQSSAAAACVSVVLPAAIIFTSRYRKHLLWGIPATVLLFAVIATVSRSYTLKDLRTPLSESTVGVRFHFWDATLRMVRAHPVSGVGAGGYIAGISSFRTPESMGHPLAAPALHHAHCFLLEVLAELGPVGVAIVGSVILCVLYQSLKALKAAKGLDRSLARGIFAGFTAMVAHSFVGVGFAYTEVQAMFWLGVSLVLAMAGLNSGSAVIGWRKICRVAGMFGAAALVLCCWVTGSCNPLRAQICLSDGIEHQRRAADHGKPVEERRRAADAASSLFEEAMSLTFAGRAYIASALHLSSTLDVRASFLTEDLAERRTLWEKALAIQRRILHEYPDYGVVKRTLAQVAYKLGYDSLAVQSAHEQIELNPWDIESYETWMLAAGRSGRPETLRDALATARRAAEERQNDVDWLYLEAGLLLALKEKEAAAEKLKQVEQLCRAKIDGAGTSPKDPTLLKYHLYLAKLLMADRPEQVRGHCKAVLEITPGHPVATELLRRLEQRGP
jgi:O-antigen ligase/tetratricopeptide (TPR) repeat protein